jgi:hypothetical protein
LGEAVTLSKKSLHFNALRKILSAQVLKFEDPRQKGKIIHELHDCCLSAFGMMYFQDPSMLEFQRRLQQSQHRNNLTTMFGVNTIPKDTQMRDNLDAISSEMFYPVFSDYFRKLQRAGQLKSFSVLDGKYLISMDGTQYFASNSISCPGCLKKIRGNEKIQYSHQVLGAAIVKPDKRHVIPLAPEPIQNHDGTDKQDCEINAGKRLIKRIRQDHPKLNIIINADSLYSKQPFVEQLQQAGMSYILVAKPKDHKYLFKKILEKENLEQIHRIEFTDHNDITHIYAWCNDLPLNGSAKAPRINFFEYWKVKDNDKIIWANSWVTDIPVNINNVKELVKAGRARWKIENENFNTLKNQGYHADHNFGHGKKNLAFNFFLLILLAFFVHQIIEMKDCLYQQARAKFSARKEYWSALRSLIKFIVFDSWDELLRFIISPPETSRSP